MSTMPVIDDNMIDLFRRMGKRRGTYRAAAAAGHPEARVVPQHSCKPGTPCITAHGALGKCVTGGHCVADFGGFEF